MILSISYAFFMNYDVRLEDNIGEYFSDEGIFDIRTSSNNPDNTLSCTFDVYYVWDSTDRYTPDITIDQNNPYEYSVIIKVDNEIVKAETDLSSTSFSLNSSSGKYEGKIASGI